MENLLIDDNGNEDQAMTMIACASLLESWKVTVNLTQIGTKLKLTCGDSISCGLSANMQYNASVSRNINLFM